MELQAEDISRTLESDTSREETQRKMSHTTRIPSSCKQTLGNSKLYTLYVSYNNLIQETSLRATQYLPDIAKLQRCLYDTFHHRLDQATAKTQTIGQFLGKLKNGAT